MADEVRDIRDEYLGEMFGKFLRTWMKETGKTKREFAKDYIHVNPNVISRWISGSAHMSRENFARVCSVLGQTPDDFIPSKHGRWIKDEWISRQTNERRSGITCSRCNVSFFQRYEDSENFIPNYCPNCGASMSMDGVEE